MVVRQRTRSGGLEILFSIPTIPTPSVQTHIYTVYIVECYALLASGRVCTKNYRSTYNITVCTVPVTK